MRSSDRTRASSSAGTNGLVTKSSAPDSSAPAFSCSPLAVTITTGMKLVAGSARSARQTAWPSRPGITMSSRTRSMPPSAIRASAASPERAVGVV